MSYSDCSLTDVKGRLEFQLCLARSGFKMCQQMDRYMTNKCKASFMKLTLTMALQLLYSFTKHRNFSI